MDEELEVKRPDKEAYLRQNATAEQDTEVSHETPPVADGTEVGTEVRDWKAEFDKTQARLEEQRSYHDRHYNDIKSKLDRREKLLSQFDNFLDKDETGEPVDWNFERQSSKEVSHEELIKDPKRFLDHMSQTIDSQLEQRFRAREETTRQEQLTTRWRQDADDAYQRATTEFPELTDKNSELFKKTIEVLKADEFLQRNPRGDYLATLMAARELGRAPVMVKKQSQNNGRRSDESIIQGRSSGPSSSSARGRNDVKVEELMGMEPSARAAAMKQRYLESVRGG